MSMNENNKTLAQIL